MKNYKVYKRFGKVWKVNAYATETEAFYHFNRATNATASAIVDTKARQIIGYFGFDEDGVSALYNVLERGYRV